VVPTRPADFESESVKGIFSGNARDFALGYPKEALLARSEQDRRLAGGYAMDHSQDAIRAIDTVVGRARAYLLYDDIVWCLVFDAEKCATTSAPDVLLRSYRDEWSVSKHSVPHGKDGRDKAERGSDHFIDF
jgi:hypothetical protein